MENIMTISVLDILEQTVLRCPDKTVVKDINGQLSYSELQNKARIFGYNLSKMIDGKRNCPIVIFIDKGCECLTAIWGVLYSGNCYVPMDIKTPGDRLESILNTLESYIIICTDETEKMLKKTGYDKSKFIVSFEKLLEVDNYPNELLEISLLSIRRSIIDTDLIYILFTSGSTGTPKGVAISHRSVVDYIYAFTAEVPIEEEDIVGNQVPFYVDMSLKDIYMTIAVGATVCVIPQKYFMTPKKVLEYLDKNQVTMLMWVPTAYSIIAQFDGLSKHRPQSLKKFLFSGEGMPIAIYRYWKQQYPTAVWIQQYGPTEITGACTSYIVDREYNDWEIIPIGKPFSNTGIILMDENDSEITVSQVNIVGEICVYGSCLAVGYYNDPEKTKETFVQNPLVKAYQSKIYRTGDLAKWDQNGNLVFISRKDYQIKHGGRRIELGEIENAVYAIPNIKTCCCVHNADKDIIVLFYVGELSEKEVREAVRSKIPPYMVPSKYIAMEELPKLPNGKLNRKKMKTIACEW